MFQTTSPAAIKNKSTAIPGPETAGVSKVQTPDLQTDPLAHVVPFGTPLQHVACEPTQ